MSDVADGPETRTSGRPSTRGTLETADELGHGLDDLVVSHDADVEIRQQRQRASPLPRPAVERDRPGHRARCGARCQRAVELVELLRRKRVVLDELHAGRAQPLVEVRRDPDPPSALRRQDLGHCDRCIVDLEHGRAIVADTIHERLDSRVRRRALDAVVPSAPRPACTADGLPHALEHDITCGHRTPTTPGTSAAARQGRSRLRPHARSGPGGKRRIHPSRTSGFWKKRASRCARS